MLKKVLWTFVACGILALFSFSETALAGDAISGAKIFSTNCAACHLGGNNVVNAAKTLKKSDLEKYEMYSLEAIEYQVTNGKNAMPAFGGKLTEAQIEDVATYILSQAEQGW
jgi:cytochrome c6